MEEERQVLEHFPPWKLQDFGLGRGVNGTDPQPWVNKSTLQIRGIIREAESDLHGNSTYTTNVIGTNEGGVEHSFIQEVTSIKDQKAKLSSSISVPNSPVTVGVGADVSRSLSTTQKAIGKRIINRTVSFTTKDADESEEYLAKLIIDNAPLIEMDSASNKAYVRMMKRLDISKVEPLFKEFVERYRVTHYVSSISLGASKFAVQSMSTNKKEASMSGEVGVQKVAQAKVSASYVQKELERAKNVQRIGILSEDFDDETELKKKRSKVIKEAVVDVTLEPISSLFQKKEFRLAMQRVLKKFFLKNDIGRQGPYLISCNDAKIFLKVVLDDNDQACVYGTTNIKDASDFYITLTDECSSRTYEFYIGWQTSAETAELPSTMRYLHAPLSMMGYHSGPLTFDHCGKKQYSVFAINSRLTDTFCGIPLSTHRSDNVNPEIWIKGFESFLVSCRGRTVGMGGFLAMQRNTGASKEEYRTICVPHADNTNAHLTFQLHDKDKIKKLIKPVVTEDEQQSL